MPFGGTPCVFPCCREDVFRGVLQPIDLQLIPMGGGLIITTVGFAEWCVEPISSSGQGNSCTIYVKNLMSISYILFLFTHQFQALFCIWVLREFQVSSRTSAFPPSEPRHSSIISVVRFLKSWLNFLQMDFLRSCASSSCPFFYSLAWRPHLLRNSIGPLLLI